MLKSRLFSRNRSTLVARMKCVAAADDVLRVAAEFILSTIKYQSIQPHANVKTNKPKNDPIASLLHQENILYKLNECHRTLVSQIDLHIYLKQFLNSYRPELLFK